MSGLPPPTVLEAFLSFLVVSGGQRPLTDLTEAQHGAWASRQLSHFRAALQAFQKIARVADLLSQPPQEATKGT